jgi:hypothetical protein
MGIGSSVKKEKEIMWEQQGSSSVEIVATEFPMHITLQLVDKKYIDLKRD